MAKKYRGIESLKSKYGMQFVIPYIIGLILFIIVPLLTTIGYAFSDVETVVGGVNLHFKGFSNFKYVLLEDASFLNNMTKSLSKLIYSVPAILVVSLVIAIILNQNFKGRIFFRALYFFPVIIATGHVIWIINWCTTANLQEASGVAMSEAQSMIDISDVFARLGLSGTFADYFMMAINAVFDIVWQSGIQIVLFISGLQSIPDSLYEVSKVEGATVWEEFWFITIPMLGRVMLLVIIFTVVELVNDTTNAVMSYVYGLMAILQYGTVSAMLWIYFLVVGVIVALTLLIFNKFCLKRWDMG